MSSVLFYLVTDLHIDDKNGVIVENALEDIFLEMTTNSIFTLVVSGDIFNFRKSQTLTTLLIWSRVLERAKELGIEIVAIPGNHDKMDYHSEDSYLDLYSNVSNFKLIRDVEKIEFSKINVWLIPFFDEKETYSKYLDRVDFTSEKESILITHIAVNGVRNNDGSEVTGGVKTNKLSKFKYVYVGHYHDRQYIGDNIIYVGSIMQRNFGEDEFKGYTKIFSDGSYEFIDKEYQVFETIKLEYSESITEDLQKLQKLEISEKLKVRVILTGTKEEVDSIKDLQVVKTLEDSGFVIRNNYVSVDKVELEEAESFTPFTTQNLKQELIEFCKLNNIDNSEAQLVLETML